MSNKKVDKETILTPHYQATRERMKAHSVVLCIEDTSFINQDGQIATPGLSPHTPGLLHQ